MKKAAKFLVTLIFCIGVAFTAVTPVFAAVAQVKGVKAKVTYNTVTLSWSKVSGVSGYEVQQYTSKKWKAVGKTKKLSYTVKKLKTGTTYKFRIVGYKSSKKGTVKGKASSTVTAKPVCVAPTSLSAVQTSSTAVKLSWKKVSGASGYTVQQYKNKKWVSIGKNVKTTSFTVSKLTPDTKVQFRVCAYTTVGKKSVSGAFSKTVTAKPQVVVPSSLALSSAGSDSVTLKWGKVSGATGYTVYSYSKSKYTKVASVKTNSATVKKLAANTAYKYAVKAYIKSGSKTYYSTYSGSLSVKTAPAAVDGLEAAAKDTSVALKWNASSGAAGYEVYVLKSGKWKLDGTTKKTSYTAEKLSSLTEYGFKVRAYSVFSKKNLFSADSATVKTKTVLSAVGSLNADTVTDTDINFSWQEVAGAESYIIEKSFDNKTWTAVDYEGAFIVKSGDRIYCSIGDLTASTVLYLRVTALSKDGVPGISSTFTGKTAPAKIENVNAVSGNDAKSAVISWPALPGAEGYIVERVDNAKTVEVKTNSCTFTGLSMNTDYLFTVKAFITVQGKRQVGEPSDSVAVRTYIGSISGFKVGTNDANYDHYHSVTWNKKADMDYVLEYYDYGNGEWTTASINKIGGTGEYFKLKEDYLGTIKNVKFKKVSDYVTRVSWDSVYNASEYTVSVCASEGTDVMIEQATTKACSVDLRLPPQTTLTFEIESNGVPCRLYGIDEDGNRTGYATATVNVISASSGTSTQKPTYTTPKAPTFSSSNDESRLLYTLKLVQAINNTKYAKGTVKATRSEVYKTNFRDGEIAGLSIPVMIELLKPRDEKAAKELEASLVANSDSSATATFKNGVGDLTVKEKDLESGKYITKKQSYSRLYNFVSPTGERYAEFYKQNDSISTFSKKVKSVSVSGNKITVVLQPESVTIKDNKADSALSVHSGLISGTVDSMSMGKGTTTSYKVGINLTEKKSKFTENDVGTTITAVLTDAYTLKSLSIVSPYTLKTNGKIQLDKTSSKIYLLADGAVESEYKFEYK